MLFSLICVVLIRRSLGCECANKMIINALTCCTERVYYEGLQRKGCLFISLLSFIVSNNVIHGVPIMSLEQAKAFIEKMKSDEAFRDHLIDIEEADFSGRLAFINSHGFDCTEADIQSVVTHINDVHLERLVEGWLYYD